MGSARAESESVVLLKAYLSKGATNPRVNPIIADTVGKVMDTNAAANNTNAIAQAIDTSPITDTIINAITAGLKDVRVTNQLAAEASIIGKRIGESVATVRSTIAALETSIKGEKIGESVASAVKSVMAVSAPKASMDPTAMREQTLSSSTYRSVSIRTS